MPLADPSWTKVSPTTVTWSKVSPTTVTWTKVTS